MKSDAARIVPAGHTDNKPNRPRGALNHAAQLQVEQQGVFLACRVIQKAKALVDEFGRVNVERQETPVLGGRRIHCAFMAEHVAPGAEAGVRKVCQEQGVLLFGRTGRAISLVNLGSQ